MLITKFASPQETLFVPFDDAKVDIKKWVGGRFSNLVNN